MSEETIVKQGASQSAALPATQQLLAAARAELGRVIAGQSGVIDEVLVAVLSQGHALLEGVPGIAKTLIVKAVGRLLGLGFQRVACFFHPSRENGVRVMNLTIVKPDERRYWTRSMAMRDADQLAAAMRKATPVRKTNA